MRKLLLLTTILLAASAPALKASNVFNYITLSSGAPSNPCNDRTINIDTSGSALYFCVSGTWAQITGSGGVGPGTTNDISFSATPVFNATYFVQNLTLTGNVTSSTVTGAVTGSLMEMNISEDSTGGRTFVWPTSFLNQPPIQSAASQSTRSMWRYDGTNWTQTSESSMSKPPMLNSGSNGGFGGVPQCYAAPWGSNSNDGLSWGSAKLTVIEGCFDAIPVKGGEIYIARTTKAQASSGYGIWIMGLNDPNYASPPTGWRQQKQGPTRFIGVAGDNQGAYFEFGGGRVGMTNCGTTADINHPCVWMSNTTNYLEFRNLILSAGRGVLIGEFSDHTRVAGGEGGGSNDFRFANDYITAAGTNNGPAADVFGTTFWDIFEDCGFASNADAVSASDRTGAAFLQDLSTVQIEHSAFDGAGTNGSGSWMIYSASGNSAAIGNHLVSEANNAPMIWFRDTGGLNGIMARFSDIQMSDSQPVNTPAVENDSPLSKPEQIVVDSAQIDNTSVCPVQGPMTLQGGIEAQANSVCPPLEQGQVGLVRGRLQGQDDTARRMGGVVTARFTNLINAATIGGSGTLTPNKADILGGTNANEFSSSSGTATLTRYTSFSNITTVHGDMYVFGSWVRSEGSPSAFNSPVAAISCGSTTWTGNPNAVSPYAGDNEWQFVHTSVIVNAGATCVLTAQLQATPTTPIDFYQDVFVKIPAGTITAAELKEYEWRLVSYNLSLSVGDAATPVGTRFSFGTPGTGSFGQFTGSLTANRQFDWPDVSGKVALVSQVNPPSYDTFVRGNSANLGSNWTQIDGTFAIASNAATSTGDASTVNFANYNAVSYGPNQFAQITISAAGAATAAEGVAVRLSGSSTATGYYCIEQNPSSLKLNKIVGDSASNLATGTVTPTAGDVLQLYVVGNTLTCVSNPTSGSPVTVTYTDNSSPIASGSPGLSGYVGSGTGSIINWSGGVYPSPGSLHAIADWISPQHFLGGLSLNTNGFQNSFTGTFTANRTTTIPDNTGTVAELNLAQAFTAAQSFTSIKATNLLVSSTAPTVSSGFGTGASITANNGTAAFRVGVGTSSATTGVIGLPTAATGWNCFAVDITTASSTVFLTKQTASSTASATLGLFDAAGAAASWVNNDVLAVSCFAY